MPPDGSFLPNDHLHKNSYTLVSEVGQSVTFFPVGAEVADLWGGQRS